MFCSSSVYIWPLAVTHSHTSYERKNDVADGQNSGILHFGVRQRTTARRPQCMTLCAVSGLVVGRAQMYHVARGSPSLSSGYWRGRSLECHGGAFEYCVRARHITLRPRSADQFLESAPLSHSCRVSPLPTTSSVLSMLIGVRRISVGDAALRLELADALNGAQRLNDRKTCVLLFST